MRAFVRVFVGVLNASLAWAQIITSTPDNQPVIPAFKTDTSAVVIDVVVTKEQDEPVLGLHEENFRVLEDGRPQMIDFLEEHTTVQAKQDVKLTPMPPHVYTNVPTISPTGSVSVLLFDSLNTPSQDLVYVREQALAFLHTLKPGTQVAIFTLGSQLNFIQGFSSDPKILLAALNGHSFEFDHVPGDPSRNRQTGLDHRIPSVVAAHDTGLHVRRGEMTLEALRILSRYLAAVPGRKNLIWFANSFPVQLFPEKQSDDRFPEMNKTVRETSGLLTLARVAVYPINAEGLMNNHWMGADQGRNTRGADVGEGAGAGEQGVGVGRGSGAGPSLMSELNRENGRHAHTISNMEQLASDTGGEAIFNTNDISAASERAIGNGMHYYTLVYRPSNKKLDGQFRQIDVKLVAPESDDHKYKLSYRRGYYADDTSDRNSEDETAQNQNSNKNKSKSDGKIRSLPPESTDSDPLARLLIHGLPGATELIYAVRVFPDATQPTPGAKHAGANDKLTGPTTRYAVDFMVDWKKVELELGPDGNHNGRIQVALLARDRTGKALNWTGGTMILDLNPTSYAEIQKSGILAHAELDLPRTDVYLATGVYDLNSHKAGTLEIPLAPPPAAIAGPNGM